MKLTQGLEEAKLMQNGSQFPCAHTSITQKSPLQQGNVKTAKMRRHLPEKSLFCQRRKIDVRDLLACNLCMDCVDACPQKPSPLKVEWEKNAFIMNIESTGALPPERVLKRSH